MFAEIAEKKDDYEKFHEQFGKCLQLGIHEGSTNRAKVAELLRFNTSRSGDEQTNVKEYMDRMKDGQNDIHSITGASIAFMSSLPFVEFFSQEGSRGTSSGELRRRVCSATAQRVRWKETGIHSEGRI